MPAPEAVVLATNLGDIKLELYWDHAPRVRLLSSISVASKTRLTFSNWQTCENFAQLAKRGYYNGVIFHRIVVVRLPYPNYRIPAHHLSKDFMVQGGDPTGTGRGGTSIYGPKLYVVHPAPWLSVQMTHPFTPAKTRSTQSYGSRVPESSQWPTRGPTPMVRFLSFRAPNFLIPVPQSAHLMHAFLAF